MSSMILASLVSFVLSLNPATAYAPTVIYTTARFNQPVSGVVCFEAEAISEDAEIGYRSTCEDINGPVKQVRWRWNWVGEYRVRATFKGGTERFVTPYQTLTIKASAGR